MPELSGKWMEPSASMADARFWHASWAFRYHLHAVPCRATECLRQGSTQMAYWSFSVHNSADALAARCGSTDTADVHPPSGGLNSKCVLPCL